MAGSKIRLVRDKLKYLYWNVFDAIDLTCFRVEYFFKNQKKTKPVWLFSERPFDARDNGVVLFEYVRKNYPEIDAYYIISEKVNNTIDYKRVEAIGNLVHHKSKQHKAIFMKADMLISAHFRGSIEPWRERIMKLLYRDYYKKKFVFIQHGVIYNDLSHYIKKEVSKFDLVIAGAEPEYKYLLKTLGYSKKEMKYTGLARHDLLHEPKVKNQILVMPTWRRYIACDTISNKDKIFQKSSYFKHYQELIDSEELHIFLEKNNLKLVFYLHAEMQKYLHNFNTKSKNIILASKDKYDVQTLLKESKLLITDYSSVMFDFAYMQKPIINYMFDKKDFDKHLKSGYFSIEKEGFGEVCKNLECVLKKINEIAKNDFTLSKKYLDRIKTFFVLNDKNNRKRITNEILKLKK